MTHVSIAGVLILTQTLLASARLGGHDICLDADERLATPLYRARLQRLSVDQAAQVIQQQSMLHHEPSPREGGAMQDAMLEQVASG